MEVFLFVVVGLLAVGFALGMLLSENAVHSALFLIANFGCVAFLFLMLNAPFISMVQIAVYAGAIMVLFLFVIMLLGAEQTTDTTRRFRWLSGAATTLALGLLFSLGLPLVIGGLSEGNELPGFEGDDPAIRFVHTATLPDVNLELTGDTLEEPVLIENFQFGDSTDFFVVAAGEYTARVVLAEQGLAVKEVPLTLEPGDVFTAVANGEFSTESQTLDVTLLNNSLSDVGNDEGRLIVLNAYTEDTLTLVDPGRDDAIDMRSDGTFIDRVVASDLGFNAVGDAVTFPEGTYNLRFIGAEGEEVYQIRDYELKADTEDTLILVPDQAAPVGPNDEPLPTIVSGLTFETLPTFGSPRGIGLALFTTYALPVNLVGFLLLVGLIGVIVLGRPDQVERTPRKTRRRRVSRPLVSVISDQTGRDVVVDTPRLESPDTGND
ncbi:MAG: NADH-quinone oxidoreductase subunit J [Aggregatilineales bacterium]